MGKPLLVSNGGFVVASVPVAALLYSCEVIFNVGFDILLPIPNIRSLLRSAIRGIDMA